MFFLSPVRVLSLSKPTDYPSLYGERYSYKAVDGQIISDFNETDLWTKYPALLNKTEETQEFIYTLTCFQTGGVDKDPWLLVDLGKIYRLFGLKFYGKNSGLGEILINYFESCCTYSSAV